MKELEELYFEALCRFAHGQSITRACREVDLSIREFAAHAAREPIALTRATALRRDVLAMRKGRREASPTAVGSANLKRERQALR